jgi:UrcA family protein
MTRKVRIIPALLSAGLVVFGFGFAVVARAGSQDVPEQTVVSYADLNLDRAEDAAKLYRRIKRAANHVCHNEIGPYAQEQTVLRYCVNASVANAVASVSHPNLSALYATRTGSGSHITAKR